MANIEIGDVVEAVDGVVGVVDQKSDCGSNPEYYVVNRKMVRFLYFHCHLVLYHEKHEFKKGQHVIKWPSQERGVVTCVTPNGCNVDIITSNSAPLNNYVSIRHLSHNPTTTKNFTYGDKSVFDDANKAIRNILNVNSPRSCKDCKGTGRILMLNKYVRCQCVK